MKSRQLEGLSPLFNSIVTLRNALPGIISDQSIPKTLSDTLINNKSYYLLQFVLQNRLLNYVGTGFSSVTKELTFKYQIIADKNTFLPKTLLQTTFSSNDLNRTDFTNIKVNVALADEKSWYYSSYLNEYSLQGPQTPIAPIAIGETAPDWILRNYANEEKETLKQYKGKVVLMEFWIKNCGYCIEAVPKLNELNDIYNQSNFKILAINTEDSRKSIAIFMDKHLVKYTVVYGDDPMVNKNYGVAAFPQVVLLDKTGKVIYYGDFNVQNLKEIIDKNI